MYMHNYNDVISKDCVDEGKVDTKSGKAKH